jgi:hypothetical protein
VLVIFAIDVVCTRVDRHLLVQDDRAGRQRDQDVATLPTL